MRHSRTSSYLFLFFFIAMSVFISGISSAEPLDNWHLRSSPVSSPLRSVTYGNGMFVAVGDNGTILRSNDGVDWTSQVSGTTVRLNGITYGNGMFVAVGAEFIEAGGTILTCPDGVNWTTRRTESDHVLNAVTYGNGTFVAVGSGETILTSLDGVSWTVRKSGVTYSFIAVTYGNGIFLVLGDPYSINMSTDGICWSIEEIAGYSDFLFFGTTYGLGTFIVVGGRGGLGFDPRPSVEIVLSSFDGFTWTQRYSGTYYELRGVAFGNSNFLAVGLNGTILSSPGGTHWTARTSGTTQWLYGATYGNGTFVVVGDKGTILQSDPMAINTNCTAILPSDLSLHAPIINVSGSYLWADFQYEAGTTSDIMLKLTNAGIVSDPSIFSSCQSSTLTYDTTYKLHIPSINFENLFYSSDLEYMPTGNRQICFKVTGAVPN